MNKVLINYFKICTDKKKVSIPYLQFEDKEGLGELRNNNPRSYFVHSRDNIYIWGNDEIQIKKSTTVNINEEKYLFLKIVTESFLKQFYLDKKTYRVKKKLQLYKVILKKNDVSKENHKGLNLFKTYSIHFHPFYIDNVLELGFTISFSITQSIIWTISDFKKNNIKYDDLEHDVYTEEIYTSQKSLNRLSQHFNYSKSLKNELDTFNSIRNEYIETTNFVNTFFKNNLAKFNLPDDLKITKIKESSFSINGNKDTCINKVLEVPESYFFRGKYPKGRQISNKRAKISYNKPFTFDEFENKEIKIALIYPESEYTKIATFFKSVQEEIISTFKINKDKIEYKKFQIANFDLNSYLEFLPKIKDIDLVIILVNEKQEILKPNKSPYYICKSKFLERGINSQEVQIEQIDKFLLNKKNNIKNYTDHNIALNIYAKLGGTAWSIQPTESKKELIFGIGATTDKEGKPVLGLTSIFQGNGKYLFGEVSTVTNMENYNQNLESIISSSIEKNIDNGIIETKNEFLLIFHIFKTAGQKNEIKTLQKVLNRYKSHNFKYSFIHIGLGHNFRFFSSSYKDEIMKIENQNQRGTYIKVNNSLAFLNLQPTNSNFIKIEIHKESTYVDLEYLTNQVYQFAEMSHTSYNKSGRPITIKYPNLMARFAEKFKNLDGFIFNDIEMENNTLWFI